MLCAEPSSDICSLLHALLDHNGYADGANVELIRRLRALTPHVPVLVYSSLSFEANRREAARAGAVSYIVKPGETDRLVDAVARLCGAS